MRPAVTAIAAALLLVGCGPARNSGGGGDPSLVAVSPSDVTTKILGGTPLQRKVLREVIAGLGPTGLDEVEIKKSAQKAHSVGLVVPHDGENVMAEWHTWLLAQGFAERSRELDLPVVAFLADERGAVDGESLGPVPATPSPTLSDAMEAAARARKAAERHGAEVKRFEILKPNGYAFLVELQVDGDQARFLRYGLPRVLHFLGGPQPVEEPTFIGDYALVVDGDGQRVWEGAEAATGDQMGGAYRRDLVECGPFLIFGPPRHRTPCPADAEIQSAERSDVTTTIVGTTPKQETVLREILEGLAPTIVEEVRISSARAPWTPFKPHSVVVRIQYSTSAEKYRGEWEAALLAQAFATRSRLLHLQPVGGYETRNEGLALDGPEEPERDTRRQIGRGELIKTITAAARGSGAEIVDLRVVQPMNPAAAVTLRVDAPAFYLKHRLERFLESMPSSAIRRYDGLYVRIVDRDDRFVWISAQTDGESLSGGPIGARKDLQGCDPIPRIGVSPDDTPPPPCPAD